MKRTLKKAISLQEHSPFHWHRRCDDAVEVFSRHHSFGGIVGISGDDTGRLLLKYALPVVERLDSLLGSHIAELFPVNSAFATPITPLSFVLGVPPNAEKQAGINFLSNFCSEY
ncbi:hypothetical protein [Thalassoglobus sp.]|uniref:hypothetical protein n=1 Tax=Thalassoglobus sp. TaxID=2795869 RepID=UPI003AA9920E